MSAHPEAELLQLGAERKRLVELRKPISEQASRLEEAAEELWKSEGKGASRDNPAGWEAYKAICKRVGLLAAEDAREAIDNQMFPLDHKIRAIPASTVAGLKVKFDLLSHYMEPDYADVGTREAQDFNVCLFNELADEFQRLTTVVSPILTLFREWEAKYAKAADMANTTDAESDDLIAQCREIELRMMQMPVGDTADFAAKMIVSTAYGGFALADAGTGGLVDEAVSILADRKGGTK